MVHHHISRKELLQAQLALLVAIGLQLVTKRVGSDLLPNSQYFIILTELALAVLIGFTANHKKAHSWGIHHFFAVLLMSLISLINITSLVFVLHSLISGNSGINGEQLLVSAIAIFMTNVIVFALWYWEIDSPGLTRTRWSRYDKDFQFTQQDLASEFPGWQPEFIDYMYLAVTNAINFAPADARPLTHQTKLLMAAQSLVSVFTLALVIARSVNILGA